MWTLNDIELLKKLLYNNDSFLLYDNNVYLSIIIANKKLKNKLMNNDKDFKHYYILEINGEYLFYYKFEKILLIDKKLEEHCLNVLQIPVGLHYLANENYKIKEIWNILNE